MANTNNAIPRPVALGLQEGTVKQTGRHNLSVKRKIKTKRQRQIQRETDREMKHVQYAEQLHCIVLVWIYIWSLSNKRENNFWNQCLY